MAETTGNEVAKDAADLAAAARDRGREQLEGAKGQLAEGAERIAAAVERTSDELEGDGDGALSGFGHSVASLMRQLAGGLRERDVDEFARELASLARRNPGVFLAGSVAVGFGIARFFKARTPRSSMRGGDRWQDAGQRLGEPTLGEREDFDADERVDLSANAARRADEDAEDTRAAGGSTADNRGAAQATPGGDESNASSNASKRQSGKQQPKPKPERDSTSTGGSTGSAAPRGGKP